MAEELAVDAVADDDLWPDAFGEDEEAAVAGFMGEAAAGEEDGMVYYDTGEEVWEGGEEELAAFEGEEQGDAAVCEELEDEGGDVEVYVEEDAAQEGEEAACLEEEASNSARLGFEGAFFKGIVYQVGGKTGNSLVKNYRVLERFGQEAVIIKAHFPDVNLHDRVLFEVTEREGQRPLATNVKVIGHCDNWVEERAAKGAKGKNKAGKGTHAATVVRGGRAKGATKGGKVSVKGKGKTKGGTSALVSGKGLQGAKAKGKGKLVGKACADLYFAGIASMPDQEGGRQRCTIACEQVQELYGCDAWFPLEEKPPGLASGGLVTFTVPRRGAEVGTSPRARFVAKLAAPSASLLGRTAAAGAAAGRGVKRPLARA